MAMDVRPRRSALYMPGSNARALEKARGLPADMLILDLEDAVAPDAKAVARRQVTEALAAGGYGSRELVVRVNGLETSWGRDDIAAVARSRVDAVLLPKVESAATVRETAGLLARNGAPDALRIWCMIETPRGVLRAAEIAAAHARLAGFVMGTSDLAKDLHARHVPGRLPLIVSLELCVLAARAHGLAILDGVHLDLDDTEGFAAACRQGAELGFDGKTLIHPKTIAAANEAFAPRGEEIAFAERIIAAHGEAERKGQGVVVVDGKLIESLHVAEAKRLVALAEAIRAREQG
ncbi:MAG: HpcH/HpaI aldolase/citrate lyase family protein [Alphaproteobacteria bacterium]